MIGFKTFIIFIISCHLTLGAPSVRVKRGEDKLDPISGSDLNTQDADREKRKLPEAAFQSKNAVLGFVFGKIDQFIDAKTRFIDQLDKSNVEKNKQLGIEPPQPIPNFQALISGVIQPKISAITQKFGSLSSGLSGSSAGGLSGLSGGSSGGSGSSSSDGEDTGSSGGSGLNGILSSVLRLSGPILSSSLGGGSTAGSSDTTTDEDDDF